MAIFSNPLFATYSLHATFQFYQVFADTVQAKQSKSQQNMGAGYAFFAHQFKQVDL